MNMYIIYHSVSLLRFTEVEIQPREYAGYVYATSLEGAFKESQSDFNPDWDKRSTSVGDVIQEHDKFFMVCGKGFKELVEPEVEPEEEDDNVQLPQDTWNGGIADDK